MTKTINSYVPDRGEVTITISSADVTAITAFTTAEDIILDGVVRKLEETQPRTREFSETFVTGSNTPIKTMSEKQSSSQWQFVIVDDYSSGATGEWGTDNLAALQIFQEFFDAGRVISAMTSTPAGGANGDIETTLTNVDVLSVPHPKIDGDSNAPNEIVIQLVVESFTKAAHA